MYLTKKPKCSSIDIFAKATNSFTYVHHSTCFSKKKNIENILNGAALRLKRNVILIVNSTSVQ